MRPIIGITSDCNVGPSVGEGGKVPVTAYCLRPTYINAVSQVGGLALILPINLEKDALEQMAQMIQGLLISGGGHDVDPRLYGEPKVAELGSINQERTEFELAMTRIVLEMGKPILGICNGLQVINVAAGGTLHQDITSQISGSLIHRQSGPRHEVAHDVFILPGTYLRQIIAKERIEKMKKKKIYLSAEVANYNDGLNQALTVLDELEKEVWQLNRTVANSESQAEKRA